MRCASLHIYSMHACMHTPLYYIYTVHTNHAGSSLNAASYFLLHPLKIVSKAVLFKELSTHFQFRIKNVTDAEDCKPGDIATLIHTNSTVPAWFETTEKYEPSFSVPSNVFSEGDVFANVLSTNRSGNECANLRYQFRVDINGKTSIIIIIPYIPFNHFNIHRISC